MLMDCVANPKILYTVEETVSASTVFFLRFVWCGLGGINVSIRINDFIFQPISTLVTHLKQRDISPVEVVNAYLEQIERLNPQLNAYVHVSWDEAIAAARVSEARLLQREGRAIEGIPIAIKDNMAVCGMPTLNGSRMARKQPASADGHVVARLRAAGAIFLGKTNLPEFATLPVTENEAFGATRNPWRLAYTPGGSSGGGAAAVAAGMAAAAHGNDGGGSLRIPGSACGLFTMKPSRGRISYAPFLGDAIGGLAVQGFLTRSVYDNALLLDLTSGFVPGDPYTAPTPQQPYVQEAQSLCRKLRIAWTVTPPFAVPVHPTCVQAVHEAVTRFERLGHQVEPYTPPGWQDLDLWTLFMNVWAAGVGWGMELDIADGLSPALAEFHNRELWRQGRALSATEYLVTITKLQQYVRRIMVTFEQYDVLLTPTLAQPPVQVGSMFQKANGDTNLLMELGGQFTPFTSVVNMTGQPGMQIPLLWVDGLPIGVQVIGRQHDEATLFQLGAQIEAAYPWAKMRPPIC